jgi:hypothetical protein
MRMIPAESVESVLSESLADTAGYILPGGARFLPRM